MTGGTLGDKDRFASGCHGGIELAQLDNATLIANGRIIEPGAGGAPDFATPLIRLRKNGQSTLGRLSIAVPFGIGSNVLTRMTRHLVRTR
jgi:hypothetical protein